MQPTVTLWFTVLALCSTIASRGSAALRLTISPAHKQARPDEDVTVLCNADVPLTRCQITTGMDVFVDLSRGRHSYVPQGYEYSGRGLRAGDCGLTMKGAVLKDVGATVVTCRVRNANSVWTYASMAVIVTTKEPIPANIESRQLVANPGKELSVLLTSNTRLTKCSVFIAGSWQNLHGDSRLCTSSQYCYHGQGIRQKQCGVTLEQVREENNGPLWFILEAEHGRAVYADFIRVIVAKPPGNPVLEEFSVSRNGAGSTAVTATCTVGGSRPAATIRWLLGGERLDASSRLDLENIVEEEWADAHMDQTVKQRLTMELEGSENGKYLWCTAEHPALKTERTSAKFKISYNIGTNTLPGGHRIYSKEDWGGLPAISSRPLYVLPHPTPYVLISHTAGPTCFDAFSCFRIVRDIQQLSTGSTYEGADILFNFLVGGDGNVYEGRGWEFTNPRDGRPEVKRNNVDFCIIGNFMNDEPTPRQLNAMRELIALGVRLGKLHPNYKLLSHNDTTPTLSPGTKMYAHIQHWPHFTRL